jgi:transcriptional regulator with XRE-family HTH domain
MPSRTKRRTRVVLDVDRFNQEIRRRGWRTQAEAASRIGITEGTLSKILSGKTGPSPLTIDRIITALGVEYSVLFHTEELS